MWYRRLAWPLLALCVSQLGGCANEGVGPGYYWQAVSGQLDVWSRKKAIDDVLASGDASDTLKARLRLIAAVRAFASRELALPDNDSYRSYADLQRAAVVWNVFAAPPLSMQPQQWCLPFAGCVAYLGYFALEDAQAHAARLRAQGQDVFVGSVPAYSTLGWFADPVLNTFVNWSEADVARLIFHELTHQLVYVKGDTEFNESFAVAVEEIGVRRWLAQPGKENLLPAFERSRRMQADFVALVLKYRERLQKLYEAEATLPRETVLQHKADTIAAMRAEYERMRVERWDGDRRYEAWFKGDINNASLSAVGYYNALVPAFTALLHEEGDDLPRFYARVHEIAQQSYEARRVALKVPVDEGAKASAP